MDNLSQQIVRAYEARSSGAKALAQIMAARKCGSCGQGPKECLRATDSMFVCGAKPW